jgi:hypothetical protein
MVYDAAIAIRAVRRESSHEGRRRRNRPETLRHMNGRLSRSLESDPARCGADPPKGSSAGIDALDLSGPKDRGAIGTARF